MKLKYLLYMFIVMGCLNTVLIASETKKIKLSPEVFRAIEEKLATDVKVSSTELSRQYSSPFKPLSPFKLPTPTSPKSFSESLSDEQFEEQLRSFSQVCGIAEESLSDESIEAIQLEMAALKLRIKQDCGEVQSVKVGKNKKKPRSQSESGLVKKEITPDLFYTSWSFVKNVTLQSLSNKKMVTDYKSDLQILLDAADRVIQDGNFLSKYGIESQKTIKERLQQANLKLAVFEKQEKKDQKEKQKEQEVAAKTKKWKDRLDNLLGGIEKSNISEITDDDSYKNHEWALKILSKNFSLQFDLIAIKSKLPELFKDESIRQLTDAYLSQYKEADSLLNPCVETLKATEEFVGIVEKFNAFSTLFDNRYKQLINKFVRAKKGDDIPAWTQDFFIFTEQIYADIKFINSSIAILGNTLKKSKLIQRHRTEIANVIAEINVINNFISEYLHKEDDFYYNNLSSFDPKKYPKGLMAVDFKPTRDDLVSFDDSIKRIVFTKGHYLSPIKSFLKTNHYLITAHYHSMMLELLTTKQYLEKVTPGVKTESNNAIQEDSDELSYQGSSNDDGEYSDTDYSDGELESLESIDE